MIIMPDFTFPMIEYGQLEMPWDLRILLYKGGARAKAREVSNLIAEGKLGEPIRRRLKLVSALHETLTTSLLSGGSKHTAYGQIGKLRRLFEWADEGGYPLSEKNIESAVRLWADSLLNRVRLKEIKPNTAYGMVAGVSALIDAIQERGSPLIQSTRLRYQPPSLRAVGGIEADKLDLGKTFEFGHLLLDIIHGLSGDAIWAPLPVQFPLRDGGIVSLWSGLNRPEKCVIFQEGYPEKHNIRRVVATREAWSNDRTLRTRWPLANLRVQVELLMFIAQTGMNLAQAHRLSLCQFSFKSTIDGYEVRDYKHRRRGEVLFEIFSEYKIFFENYLAWRKDVFPNAVELFPIIRKGRAFSTPPAFGLTRLICNEHGVPYIGPKLLRKARVNWILRESRDPDLTAEQAQHTKQMLLQVYHQPSMQIAMREIVQFWPTVDPSIRRNAQPSLAAGLCDSTPRKLPNIPSDAPQPNCVHPAGCLFCDSHRDIDSENYVWSLVSMHYLSKIVLRGYRAPANSKADAGRQTEHTVNALSQKLAWFVNSNGTRKGWVEEALARTDEGDFHPHWRIVIESARMI